MGFYSFLWKCIVLLWCAVQKLPPKPVQQFTPEIKNATQSLHLKSVHRYMNESVDPCENFYDFACGNWKTYYPANQTVKHTTRLFDELNKDFDRKLTEILKKQDVTDNDSERKVKTFYFSCLNPEGGTKFYIKEKFKQIASEFDLYLSVQIFQGHRREQAFDWLETVAQISHKYGLNIIFGYSIKPDAKDNTAHNLILGSPNFAPHYQRLRHEYETILGYLNLNAATANGIAWELVDFESALLQANRYGAKSSLNDSIDSIHKEYFPHVDIKKFLNISLGYVPVGVVWLENPGYLENLIKTLKWTPKKLLINYIVTKLLHHFWTDLPLQSFEQMDVCLKITKEKFPHILSQMFFKSNKALNERIYAIETLWSQITSTLRTIFDSKRPLWFDKFTRQMAREKLNSMTLHVATYQDYDFDQEYRWLWFTPNDYIENLRSLSGFEAFTRRHSLYQKPQHEHISLDLKTPVYVISSNSIVVPVSILNSNFLWSTSNLNLMNVAHLGFCLAHEIMHAFSGAGRNYNQLGNFYKYWNKHAEHEYTKLEACFADQYGNLTENAKYLPKLHRQVHKQDENIADNAGIVLAYETFKQSHKYELDTTLTYTYDQLFFITYAQLWCSDTWRKETMQNFLPMGRHAHNELRVLVPLKNFDQFSSTFKCPKGSPMNPNHKCKFFH